ncbi:MAG: class I SAM-dependent methyltransferase, partial [Chthoniobacterales bacterium]
YYRRLETLVFGDRLQAARCAFVRQLPPSRRALIVGEGDGRFLEQLREAQPELPVECIDASEKMLELARARVGDRYTQFIQADIREAAFPPARYDLVVTHFFLDCFEQKELSAVVKKLSAAAMPNAIWLVADFQKPARGWHRALGQLLIVMMYLFFRSVAGLKARRLVDYAPFLAEHSFFLEKEIGAPNDIMRSQLWRRR